VKAERAAIPAWVVAALTFAALLVRLPLLNYSFYGDEGFSLLRDSSQLITATEDRFRPLFFSLLYIWRQIGFSGEVGLRLLPLLFGVAQIPLAFFVGRRLRDERLGLALAILCAASPMLIEFSQELRMYSMITAIALGQALVTLQLFERDTWPRRIAFVLIATAGVYTHLLYWFLLAGIAVTFVRERARFSWIKGWALLASTVALYLPNIPNLLRFMAIRGDEYPMDFGSAIPKLLAAFTVGFSYFDLGEQGAGRAIGTSDLAANLPLIALAGVVAIAIVWKLVWLHSQREMRPLLLFGHEWFTIPVIIATLASTATGKYFLQPKYLIFSLPFALLFIALTYEEIRNGLGRHALATLAVVIFAISMVHYWQPQDHGRKEDWRTAAEVLSTSVGEQDALVLLPGHYRLLTYYAPGIDKRWEQLEMDSRANESIQRLNDLASSKRHVYYLRHDVVQNLRDPQDRLIETMNDSGMPLSVTQLNPRFKLYRWGKP